jgi:hypothetical protein
MIWRRGDAEARECCRRCERTVVPKLILQTACLLTVMGSLLRRGDPEAAY